MENFDIRPMQAADIGTTYPLMRQVLPSLDPARWSRFARRMANPRCIGQHGIVVAKGARRLFPSGLVCYRKQQDLSLGAVLVADHFVAVDLLDPGPIVEALAAALDNLAVRLECRAIRSVVHQTTQDVTSGLVAAGHRPEGATLCKLVPEHDPIAAAAACTVPLHDLAPA